MKFGIHKYLELKIWVPNNNNNKHYQHLDSPKQLCTPNFQIFSYYSNQSSLPHCSFRNCNLFSLCKKPALNKPGQPKTNFPVCSMRCPNVPSCPTQCWDSAQQGRPPSPLSTTRLGKQPQVSGSNSQPPGEAGWLPFWLCCPAHASCY